MKPERAVGRLRNGTRAILDSFLIEITADILGRRIRSPASRSSTSCSTRRSKGHRQVDPAPTRSTWACPPRRWPKPSFARASQRVKEERVAASKILTGPAKKFKGDKGARRGRAATPVLLEDLSYAQGFQLMRAAQEEYKWKLDFGEIAQIWRGGCIIRARLLAEDHRGVRTRIRSWPTCCSIRSSRSRPARELAQIIWRQRRAASVPTFAVRPWPITTATAARTAGEPAAGAARLLRRPHLRARRSTAGQVLPPRLGLATASSSARPEPLRVNDLFDVTDAFSTA